MPFGVFRTGVALTAALTCAAGSALAQKYGGTLQAVIGQNPPSLSIHEEATVTTTWTMQPVYSNLVLYDPLKSRESFETIIPELAESWRWNPDRKSLTFTLRRGVKFHDGKPLTSNDVKHTFDVVRGVTTQRLKLNPRKLWYLNVEEIVTTGDDEVTFKLKRPQPSLLAMLASGYSPVYPAHIKPQELRTTPMGSGPFIHKEYQRGRFIRNVRNLDYFIKGRPYLDALQYNIIPGKGALMAALAAKQLDIDTPHDTTLADMEALKSMAPGLVFPPLARTAYTNVIFNTKRPPFNDARLRQVVTLALDREAFGRAVFGGAMVIGGVMLPPADGVWGLPKDRLDVLPGFREIGRSREEARQIMASLGYGPTKPLKLQISCSSARLYLDPAIWMADQLKQVWIDAEVNKMDIAVWYGVVARRDFALGLNATALGADDPDVQFYENYGCGSQRNYSDYCNPKVQQLVDAQSQEFDLDRRRALVWDIDQALVEDAARLVFGFRINYHAMWPHLKNVVPHQAYANWGRMQEVWLDK
ncbi:MAG: ABC transporter substrate-binding protein [Candidatus Lambdaproteobacteria bacterium]|nr:ABC transporter substrate-binding protein [Candidatus Lambdaproteobacteria bacterium]